MTAQAPQPLEDPAIEAPSLAAFRATAARIAPHVVSTPVHRWQGKEIDAHLGPDTEVMLKFEMLQRTGTFKARGAINSVLSLEDDALANGITAVSAGNHAIAAAFAAQRIGTSAKVVMLATADPARIERAQSYGAEVLIAPTGAEAFALAEKLVADEGRSFIHPFEGPRVAEGTGTLGLEFLEQVGNLDAVIIPIGGGGLCGGVSRAIKLLDPDCRVIGVEPEGADTMSRSFDAGSPQTRSDVKTIADSLAPPFALPYSFALCRQNVDRMLLIDDDSVTAAMALLFREMKLAVEPAAAVATAALIGPLRDELRGKRVGIIICGANIAADRFAALLERGTALGGRQ